MQDHPKSRIRSHSSEFDLIERFFAPLTGSGSFGLKDDAASFTPRPGFDLVITQDAIHQGVHFFPDTPFDLIAQRAVRSNISDIIAKGGTPVGYTLALGLPKWVTDDDLASLSAGLSADQNKFKISLLGGDTFATEENLTLAITMFGEVPSGKYVSRLGAQDGDLLAVTGTIGDPYLGLKIQLSNDPSPDDELQRALVERQVNLAPPFGIQSIIANFASASMDISDGFVGDLRKLCQASGVSAVVEVSKIPISEEAQQYLRTQERPQQVLVNMLTGGDDYQTLFTLRADDWENAQKQAASCGIEVAQIGTIGIGPPGKVVVLHEGVPMSFDTESYTHA